MPLEPSDLADPKILEVSEVGKDDGADGRTARTVLWILESCFAIHSREFYAFWETAPVMFLGPVSDECWTVG